MRHYWFKGSSSFPKKPFRTLLSGAWLTAFIMAVGLLITLLLWYAIKVEAREHVNHIAELQTVHLAHDIQTQFQLRISALKLMAKHLESNPQLADKWQFNIVEFVKDYDGIDGIGLYNSNLNQTWLSLDSHSSTDACYQHFMGQYRQRILATSIYQQLWISPSIKLTSDEQGFFVVIPLHDKHQPLGYLISLINTSVVFTKSIKHVDYAISIKDSSDQLFYAPATYRLISPKLAKTSIDLYGVPWQVDVQLSQRLLSAIETDLPNAVLILGTLLTFLFVITSRIVEVSRGRSSALIRSNAQLKSEIAERKAAEKAKRKMERAMLQGQKLQAIGTLAGGIAHDFNNLIYAITGYAEMARDDVPKNSIVHANLGKVLEAAKRGQELISRILSFSRRQQHDALHPIRVKETIENVLGFLRPTVPGGVEILYNDGIDPEFGILGDQTQLHQVIVNLVNNAVDAMYGEGTVHLNLKIVNEQDPDLQSTSPAPGSRYIRIEVSDTGQGIDQNILERIFEPFFTTKEVGKGTGLGLATVHAIIKEHLGFIVVQSVLGKGSTFIIFLPEC